MEQITVYNLSHAVELLTNQLVIWNALDKFAKKDTEKQSTGLRVVLSNICFSYHEDKSTWRPARTRHKRKLGGSALAFLSSANFGDRFHSMLKVQEVAMLFDNVKNPLILPQRPF